MAAYFPFAPVDYPRLRPGVVTIPTSETESAVVDSRHLVPGGVYISPAYKPLLALCDGKHSQAELASQSMIPAERIAEFIQALDRSLLLDSPAFAAYLASPQRLPACLGAYPQEPTQLEAMLAPLFPDGVPEYDPHAEKLRAMLVPHMDYQRGGTVYGKGFAEIARRCEAEVFIVVATSHYSLERFSLTRKDFWTPFGTIPTEQPAVDLLEQEYGPGIFNDPYAHLPEHSIELELLLLQYIRRIHAGQPFTVVPILVGSFHDTIENHLYPMLQPDIARMVTALKRLDQHYGERACWLISGDLAHLGPKFRDPEPVNEAILQASASQDERLLATLRTADPAEYFRIIHEEDDARRVCGFPPTWLTLSALTPTRGTIAAYHQYKHPHGYESVSFASAALY